jgi:hypothetical protein
MWFDLLMETKLTHANDNFDPWSSIGLAASMILNRLRNERLLLELREEQQEEAQGNAQPDRHEEQKAKDHSEYVNHRLRELAAFERRIDGNKKRKV